MTEPTPLIKDVETLRSHMQSVDPEHKVVDDDRLIWFTCIQYARSLSEARTKDIARMFKDGIEPLNTLDHVQEYLDSHFEDYDLDNLDDDDEEYVMEQNAYILHEVKDFYGIS